MILVEGSLEAHYVEYREIKKIKIFIILEVLEEVSRAP